MFTEELLIESGRSERNYFRDLWRFRELFYILAWRDLAVRYKQTVIGVAWAVVRPILTMVVFTVVFGKIAKLPSGGIPYPVLVFAGMLPWQFFSTSLTEASNSLISNSNLISKVYFPRLIVPASSVITSLVDFGITCVLLGLLMAIYRVVPSWHLVALPLFVALAFFAATGCGLWLAALNVEYRDFRYIVPFIVQFGMYVSPVGFSSEVVPEKWRWAYSLNPMVGVIDGFRWSVLGDSQRMDWGVVGLSAGLVLLVLITGLYYFRRMERGFADVI